MVCLAIPTLRPLYLRNRDHGSTTIDYTSRAHTDGVGSDPELPRFTMLSDHKPPMTPQSQWSEPAPSPQRTLLGTPNPLRSGAKSSISSPRQTVIRDSGSSHTMVEHWQPDHAPVRSLSPCPPSPDEDVDPDLKLPLYSTEGTILRPSSVYTKRSRRDSVDDILGLYNERSRSRGGASSLGRSQTHEPNTSSGQGVAITTTTNHYDVQYCLSGEPEGGRSSTISDGDVAGHGSYRDLATSHGNTGHDRIRTGVVDETVKVNMENWPLTS